MGDFYMLINFLILDIAEDAWTQIILGRPFLVTAGCKIIVKERKLTFDVGKNHVSLVCLKIVNLVPLLLLAMDVKQSFLIEHVNMLDIWPNEHPTFYYALFEGQGLDGDTVDSLSPSIVKDEPYAINEGYFSNCCRFVTLMMFIPPMSE